MRKFFIHLFVLALVSSGLYSQNSVSRQKATIVGKATKMIEVPSIASQIEAGTFIPAENILKEYNPKKRGANIAVPGKGLPLGADPLANEQRDAVKIAGTGPILTFEAASSGSTPTDPTGAVGPDHFVNSWNSSFRIWDKEGTALTNPASLGTIFPGETAGDPIVMYDAFADRFILTEFTFKDGFLVAISQGPDPVNDGWYTYEFLLDAFPDYPKFSVWSDGYYITANKNSGSAQTSEVVFVIERDEIINGNPDAQIVGFPLPDIITSGFYSPLGFNANGSTLPPAGNAPIVYMQDDVWSGVDADHLKLWFIDVDWDDPASSTISDPELLYTEEFDGLFDGGSFSNLPQPNGPDLDALQATIMYMAQYRRFSDHNSVVFNFVVDLDGNDDLSGIRWYELRQDSDGDPWTIYQEGTYAQPDGHSAYSGTMCTDVNGNIGLTYTVVSETQEPSIRYTGRFSTDPLNVMTVEEEVIVEGVESDPSNRYGDYAQMTVDPTDDKTFWSISEYFNGGTRKDQVGVFKLAPDFTNDIGIISIDSPTDGLLGAEDSVKVTIRNFGVETQVDFEVNYQIDGGEVVTEMITDSVYPTSNLQYTFMTTGDFSTEGATYSIASFTSLSGDQNMENDTLTVEVTHLFANDLGVVSINAPQSGPNLTDEQFVVTLENSGGAAQSNFDITYVLNEGTPVTEQVAGPFEGSSTMEYTFSETIDFSQLGEYNFVVYTSLPDDVDSSNDTITQIIESEICQPISDCSEGDGIARFQLGSVDNISGCDDNGYGDYMDLVAETEMGPFNDLTLTTFYGDQYVKLWVDFNDDFVFDLDELLIDNLVIAPGQGAGNYVENIILDIPLDVPLGDHILRVKTNWDGSVPNDACEATGYGETEDYTTMVSPLTGLTDITFDESEMIVSETQNNQFKIRYAPEKINETLTVTVHNISGQKLISNRVEKNGDFYEFAFDMSYAKPGMYLVRLGTDTFGKVKRIIVK